MAINFKHINKIISNPSVLAPTVFIAIGAGKSAIDYYKAPEAQKKQVLIKDSAILTGSVLGYAAMNPLVSRFCKTRLLGNKIVKNTAYVIKQAIGASMNTFAGVVGAIYGNELIHKYVINKGYFVPPPSALTDTPESIKTRKVFNNFLTITPNVATKAANRFVSNISDLPSMKVLSSPMIALTGFSVANVDGYHNKLKKTTNEIIANTLIPTIFVSTTALFVDNKRPLIKYPALAAALGLGSFVGLQVAKNSQDAIGKGIDKINLEYLSLK